MRAGGIDGSLTIYGSLGRWPFILFDPNLIDKEEGLLATAIVPLGQFGGYLADDTYITGLDGIKGHLLLSGDVVLGTLFEHWNLLAGNRPEICAIVGNRYFESRKSEDVVARHQIGVHEGRRDLLFAL